MTQEEIEPPGRRKARATWWTVRRKDGRARLFAKPRTGAQSIELVSNQLGDSEASGPVVKALGSRPGWLQIGRGGEGVTLTGWIHRSEVVPARVGDEDLSSGCAGEHTATVRLHAKAAARTGVREGPAALAKGTVIFADRGTGEWATVVDMDGFEVRTTAGDPWAEVTKIPGIGGTEVSAFVRSKAVTMEPQHAPSAR